MLVGKEEESDKGSETATRSSGEAVGDSLLAKISGFADSKDSRSCCHQHPDTSCLSYCAKVSRKCWSSSIFLPRARPTCNLSIAGIYQTVYRRRCHQRRPPFTASRPPRRRPTTASSSAAGIAPKFATGPVSRFVRGDLQGRLRPSEIGLSISSMRSGGTKPLQSVFTVQQLPAAAASQVRWRRRPRRRRPRPRPVAAWRTGRSVDGVLREQKHFLLRPMEDPRGKKRRRRRLRE